MRGLSTFSFLTNLNSEINKSNVLCYGKNVDASGIISILSFLKNYYYFSVCIHYFKNMLKLSIACIRFQANV